MAVAIKLPDMGTNVEECRIQAWRVQEGEPVKRGTVLAEIETDKAIAELESTAEGVLLRHVVSAGEVVCTGQILAYVGQAGEAVPRRARDEPRVPQPGTRPQPATSSATSQPAAKSAAPTRVPAASGEAPRVSPVVRNLAAKLGVDLTKVRGTGAGGMITREDVLRATGH